MQANQSPTQTIYASKTPRDLAVLDHARKVLTRLANLPSATQSATHHAQR